MTMFSDLVAFLGGAAGIALLAVMAFVPLLLDLPARRPRRAASALTIVTATPARTTPAEAPAARVDIPAQRAAETVGVRA